MSPSAPSPKPAFPLVQFNERRHKNLLLALFLIFVVALSFRLHGWSLSAWHYFLDGAPLKEVIVGEPKAIRSDDWCLDLPLIFAQTAHRPSFPIINTNIGEGQHMLAPIKVPSRNFITLFRPTTWGFFVGNDFGLSWMWWTLEIGIFYSFFLVFLLITRNQFWLSFWAACAFIYAPYFQFWSLHKGEIAIHWAGVFIATAYLLASTKRSVIWLAGIFLSWSFIALALDSCYPPIAISAGWLLPFAGLAWIINFRKELTVVFVHLRARIGSFGLALVTIALSFYLFYIDNKEAIQLIPETAYPGHRFSTGGGYPFWAFFGQDILAQNSSEQGSWIGNICEASSFFYTLPSILPLLFLTVLKEKKWPNVWSIVVGLYIIAMMIYTYVGFPDCLARFTLMGMSTSNRTQLGIGLADLLILVALLASSNALHSLSSISRYIVGVAWLVGLVIAAIFLKPHWPALETSQIALGILFQVALFWFWWIRRLPSFGMCLLALVSIVYTFKFNPIVRGGSDYFFKNPLSAKIIELDDADHSVHKWIVVGDWISNLPRMIGVKSLGGYHGHPQFALWKHYDPEGKYRSIYNQCAFINFKATQNTEIRFSTPGAGQVDVEINPESEACIQAFQETGVHYIIASGQTSVQALDACDRYTKIFIYLDKAIFAPKSQ